MSSKLAKILKASIGGGSIIGFGYLLMKYTTPSDDELIAKLSPELRAKYEEQKEAKREQNRLIYERIQREGYSDKPAWMNEPKDLFMNEAEREKDLQVRMREEFVDKELQAEKERMRKLAEHGK